MITIFFFFLQTKYFINFVSEIPINVSLWIRDKIDVEALGVRNTGCARHFIYLFCNDEGLDVGVYFFFFVIL